MLAHVYLNPLRAVRSFSENAEPSWLSIVFQVVPVEAHMNTHGSVQCSSIKFHAQKLAVAHVNLWMIAYELADLSSHSILSWIFIQWSTASHSFSMVFTPKIFESNLLFQALESVPLCSLSAGSLFGELDIDRHCCSAIVTRQAEFVRISQRHFVSLYNVSSTISI